MIKGAAEEDSVLVCIPVNLMEEWMVKFPSWKKCVMTTIWLENHQAIPAGSGSAGKIV
ncbi:MAG: hypothetical protein ACTHMC_25365 [Pseudobacter sp.]|uniref:hypothetical protein n=1 Tax=Pseudobacter sp. TaxID=2045420 RepID=UPI003F80E251